MISIILSAIFLMWSTTPFDAVQLFENWSLSDFSGMTRKTLDVMDWTWYPIAWWWCRTSAAHVRVVGSPRRLAIYTMNWDPWASWPHDLEVYVRLTSTGVVPCCELRMEVTRSRSNHKTRQAKFTSPFPSHSSHTMDLPSKLVSLYLSIQFNYNSHLYGSYSSGNYPLTQ